MLSDLFLLPIRRRCAGALALLLLVPAMLRCPAEAQEPASAKDMLLQMRDASSLDHEGEVPFHLKVSFQIFDQDGKPTQPGTLELWYAGLHHFRRQITLAGQLVKEDAPLSRELYLARTIQENFLSPMLEWNPERAILLPTLKREAGALHLTCYPIKPDHSPAPIYCRDESKPVLRAVVELPLQTFFARMGDFTGTKVPLDLFTEVGHTRVLTAHVEELRSLTAEEAEQKAGPMKPAESAAQSPGTSPAVVAGRKIGGDPPHYPGEAKYNHISGSVLLGALIDEQGSIEQLVVIASPDKGLSEAAMAAVRTWRYQPYLLNGKPTKVDTSITINFNLNSW